MNDKRKKILIALADNNMKVTEAAKSLFLHRNTVLFHLRKVKEETGLDPCKFHDLCKLYAMVIGE